MKVNRRIFLAALAAGTAHLMFAPLFASETHATLDLNPLQRIKLGKSGLETTLLGFGTGVNGYSRSSFLTRQDEKKSIAVLIHGYNRGIRLFDLADLYGTHGIMKEALKEMNRDELTLVSKMWTLSGGIPENERPDANIVVDRFRKELDTDVIDLIQLHCLVDGQWTDAEKKQMDILETLKSKKIIRAHGTSVHSYEALKAAVQTNWVDVLHARINPYGIAMDKHDPQEVVDVLKQLHQSGKGIIGMKLVGNGEYKTNSEMIDNSIKFVLGLNVVDMIIVGFETEAEIDNYLERMEKALKELKVQKN
jgi:aryl-alcohol dehydrogenase-like predicted oxidoreductase